MELLEAKKIMDEKLGDYKIMALASCVDDYPMVRNVSCVFYNDKIYFKTDKNFRKTQQLFKNDKVAMIISFITACIIKYGIYYIKSYNYLYWFLCTFNIFPIIFISLYNKKQGPKVKYLLYLFYPIHLLVLYLFTKYI